MYKYFVHNDDLIFSFKKLVIKLLLFREHNVIASGHVNNLDEWIDLAGHDLIVLLNRFIKFFL